MNNINSINTTINVFIEEADKHAVATLNGDYKMANKSYNKIVRSIKLLKEKNELNKLLPFLKHKSVGVQIAVATFLLPYNTDECLKKLEDIAMRSDIQGLNAATIISEWKKGSLEL